MHFSEELGRALKGGMVAVIPTDTIYGIVASATNREAVERVYALKRRSPEKPCIILIADPHEMREFGVDQTVVQKVVEYPTDGPTSFIVPITRGDLGYLDRETHTLAFRIPKDAVLVKLLTESGPLIAPSANPEGLAPATTIDEAKEYFGNTVEHYVDGGTITGSPSALIDVQTGERLR